MATSVLKWSVVDWLGWLEKQRTIGTASEYCRKIPMIKKSEAMEMVFDNGIRTNCTLSFSARVRRYWLQSRRHLFIIVYRPFDDKSWMALCLSNRSFIFIAPMDLNRSVGSLHSQPAHCALRAEVGADVVTCPLNSILGLFKHPLTDIGWPQFLADYIKGNGTGLVSAALLDY